MTQPDKLIVDDWISAEDALPLINTEVFILVNGKVTIGWYHGSQFGWNTRGQAVTHWMPKEWFDL